MSFKDDISEAKSKEFNYIHKANEDFADDIIESNTNCWSCGTDIPLGKKYCEYHCGHPADEFDSFTGQCKACGKSLNVNMMMAMPVAESKATEVKIERGNGSMTIDGKPVIKIWESFNGWYWYAVEDQGEYVGVGADGNDVEAHAWFGYVQADFNEWGTFDSKELERAGVWEVPRSNWAYTGRMEESKASESDGMQVDWWDSLSQDERSNWMNSFSMTPTDGSIYMDNYDEMDSSNQYYVKSLFRFVKDNMNNDLLGRNHDIFESKASEMMLSMKTSQLIHPSDNNKYGSPDRAVRVTLKWNEDSETGEQSNVELLLDDNVIQTFSDRKEGEQKYREVITDRSGESKANEAVCPKCNGYGGIAGFSDMITCPKCNGSGKIYNYYVRRNGKIEAIYDNFNEARDDALAYGGAVMATPTSSVDLLDQYYAESKASDDYEVDVDEYIKTGEPVQKQPTDKRAGEYLIQEEFDLQDQDGKYEMLSKANLSVADATKYSTYSHSELPEEVKDSLKGDEDSFGESWSRKSSIEKIEALERLGIKQGDAVKLSGVEFEDFGEDLQGALKDDVENARMHMKADKDMLDKADPLEPSYSFQWQEGGEVDNPNSEFQQYYPDYNNIGESQTKRTKYECEYCNLGFKSNESLSKHHKSIHYIANEDIDGYSVDAGFTGQNSFTDMSSISKDDITQSWWDNFAKPSTKARILNKTGTPVENTFNLPSYYELTQETKSYLLGLDDFSFESKATEDSLIKIEDDDDKDTKVTVLDEWENETDPDVGGNVKGLDQDELGEGSEDVYNYQYVDDKVVCKHCGMTFDSAIDDARAMKNHSEIHESLYDKESKAVEYTDEEQKILDHTMEAARMEGFAMDPNAFTTPHTWVQGSAGADDIYCKICGVSKSFENHPTEDEMDVLDPYRSYRKSPDKPQKTWDYRETGEAGLDDHSCPECGFITSDNSDYIDHLNAHED